MDRSLGPAQLGGGGKCVAFWLVVALEAMSIIIAIGLEDGRLCFALSQKYFDQIYCWFRSSFKNLLTKNDRSLAKNQIYL